MIGERFERVPAGLRIVQAFLGDRALTTSALAAELADVPAASLYRHVARLVDAGVPSVVILVSSREASDYDGAIGESGARGFISKAELSGQAVRALLEV